MCSVFGCGLHIWQRGKSHFAMENSYWKASHGKYGELEISSSPHVCMQWKLDFVNNKESIIGQTDYTEFNSVSNEICAYFSPDSDKSSQVKSLLFI